MEIGSQVEPFLAKLHRRPILTGILLALATVLLYGPVRHHELLNFLDDDFYVTKNVHVNTGLHLDNVVWAFTSYYEANWHPLTWLSHMADCQLFGLDPGPQHLVNVLVHAANVLLLFLLLERATGACWRSFFVAALFAAHPLNVETVAWIAERKSLLCTFFSLLTIAAYGWYVRRPDWRRYPAIVAAFSLALMSKPMAVSLPIALLLLDYWPLQRFDEVPFWGKWVRLSIEKLPLFLLSAASCLITLLAQRSAGGVADTSSLPLWWRLENAVVSYVAYIGKVVFPVNLAVFYPHPWESLPWPDVIASAIILGAITAASLYFHRARYLAMGWFFFLTTLIPVIGIVQVGRQAMADRYTYVAAIGLFVIAAWGVSSIVRGAAIPRVVPAAVALCLIVASATATRRYLACWQNGVELFTHARNVASQPDFFIEEGLAENLASAGQFDDALLHYKVACRLRPMFDRCHYKMAELLVNRGQLQEALEEYELVGTHADRKDIALLGLINAGKIRLDMGDYKGAETNLTAALQVDPNNNRALLLLQRALKERNQKGR